MLTVAKIQICYSKSITVFAIESLSYRPNLYTYGLFTHIRSEISFQIWWMTYLHFQVIQERKSIWLQSKQNSNIQQEYDDIGECVTDTNEWGAVIKSEGD